MQKLDSLLQYIHTSREMPKLSGGGFFYNNPYGPITEVYIYVKDRNDSIEFHNQIDKLWRKEKVIFDNISKDWFQQELMYIIRRKLTNGEEIKDSDLQDLKNSFLSKPIVTSEIFKEIKGCKINSKQPINIDEFNFYNWPKHFSYIKNNYPKAFENQYPSFYDERKEMTLISTKASAIDPSKAEEIAYSRFKKIENVLRYFFTDTEHNSAGMIIHDIGIFDFRERGKEENQIVTDDSKGGSYKTTGTYKDIVIKKSDLINKKKSKIWEIINKPNPSKIEKRIINSIEWIGKAKHEIEQEKAFIQYFFAIESLMNFNSNGTISPSVGFQMKEYIAFILGKNESERLRLDTLFQKLYGIRSSIVHGNSSEFSIFDLEDVKDLAEKLVLEFTSNKQFENLSSENNFEELRNFILKKKYSCC